ncbi:MAG: glycogen synthase [Acidobacteria bacterium]|nr:MAG: glycogen synthase [Acidobacteriota bacterium]
MRIAHVTPEIAPLAKAGGLGDVAAALPVAQARAGHDVTVVVPGHPAVVAAVEPADARLPVACRLGGETLWGEARIGRHRGVRLVALVHDRFFARPGIYGENHVSYPDNGERFGWFCGAARDALRRLPGGPPDAVVCHDWPAALLPLLIRVHGDPLDPLADAGTLQVIHNLAHQGVFPLELAHRLEIPALWLDEQGAEALGRLNMLKAGIRFASYVVTVSPTYAREIVWPYRGEGLHRELHARGDDLVGILNGLDTETWDPARDPHLAARYDAGDLRGKHECKRALQRELGLGEDPRAPLFGMVSRIDRQKGIPLVAAVAPWLADEGAQFALLGSGDRDLLAPLEALARDRPRSVAVVSAFDEGLAHRIYAGADFFVMPSLFEPCGLGQMVAMRYGTPPVVRRTGGLADTVVDVDESPEHGTGFVFDHPDPGGLRWACGRALAVYRRDVAALDALRRRGMQCDFSWTVPAARYEALLARARRRESARVLR